MPKQPKPCKIDGCEKKRYANLTICYSHHLERERAKRDESKAKAKARKESTKKWQKSRRKTLNNRAWKLMSEWVRRKDADWRGNVPCYTCDAVGHYKEMQAGHRHHGKLDYDERNIHVQCAHCNGQVYTGGLSGNLGEYEYRLTQEHGPEWTARLRLDANTHPGYSFSELEETIKDLESKIKSLEQKT